MERKPREDIIDKLNRRLLIALVIDFQFTQPRTVIDRSILIVPASRSGNSLKELHVDLDPVAWFRLLISFPSLFMPFIALKLGKAVNIKLLQDPPDPRGTDGNIMISQQIHLDFPRAKVDGINVSWPTLMRDLGRVQAVRVEADGHTYILRTDLQATAHQAFLAAGVRPPSPVTMLD